MDIYESSKWLFFVLKSLGLAPYSVDRKTRQFKMNLGNYLIVMISFVVSVLLITFELIYTPSYYFETGIQSQFLEAIWRYAYFFQQMLAVFILGFNASRRQNVENLMSLLHNFDQTIEKLGWQFKAKQTKTINLLMLYVVAAILLAAVIFYGTSIIPETQQLGIMPMILNSVTYAIVSQFFLFVSIQFILSANAIVTRLDAMINNIR